MLSRYNLTWTDRCKLKLNFSSDFQTFPAGDGWVGVENEINANSAFNYVEVEVEAELDKKKILTKIVTKRRKLLQKDIYKSC